MKWLWLALALTATSADAANRLFKWDVESGTLGNYWSQVQSIMTISTDRAHSGSKSMKYAPTTTGSTNGDTFIRIPKVFDGSGDNDVNWTSTTNELYISWWQWYPTNQNGGGAGAHGWRLHPPGNNTIGLDSQTWDGATGGKFGWGIAYFDPGIPNGGAAIEPPTVYTVILGQWNHLELYVKLGIKGTPTDTLRFWVNGTQTFNRTNMLLRAGGSPNNGWGEWAITTNFDPGAPHPNNSSTWYLDDIEIWDGMLPVPPLIPPVLRVM